MKKKHILFLFMILLITNTVNAIPPGTPDHPEYEMCNTEHLDDPTPGCFQWNVNITPKGIQTCINITIDPGCTANITMYWYNWTYAIETYGEENALMNPYPDAWVQYYYEENIAASTQICTWDENVTCRTENWWTEVHPIFITAYFNCSGIITNETMMTVFFTEECPLFNYIEPAYNETVCPCCDNMCIGVNNTNGNPMNLTFYRAQYNGSDPDTLDYYQVKQYLNVTNGTFCFCIDGYIDTDSKLYVPLGYNESYHWYVNMTDTVTGDYNVSSYYFFQTCEHNSDCPCGEEELVTVIHEHGRGEIVETPGFEILTFSISCLILLYFFSRKHKKQHT